MTLAGSGAVLWSLIARLDIVVPSLRDDTPIYAGNRRFVTAKHPIRSMLAAHRGHKNASRVAPARTPHASCGDFSDGREVTTPASGRCRPHGSRRWTD